MTPPDPFGVLSIPNDTDWPPEVDGASLFHEALQLALSGRLEPVRSLLVNASSSVRSRGLVLFGEMGRRAEPLLAEAVQAAEIGSQSDWSNLLNGMLSFPQALTLSQRVILLGASEFAEPLVRLRLIVLLSAWRVQALEEAVALLDCGRRAAHTAAFNVGRSIVRVDASTFEMVRALSDKERLYGWVALLRLARRKAHDEFPHFELNDDWVAAGVRWQIVRRSRRWRANRAYRVEVLSALERTRRLQAAEDDEGE